MISCSDVVVVVPHYSYTKNIPLIVSELGGHFEIVVVNDGCNLLRYEGVKVLKTEGLGFSKAVNVGLSYAQSHGKKWSFILNDDAFIFKSSLMSIISNIEDAGLYAPVLVSENKNCYGFNVSFLGRVNEIRNRNKKPKALSGAALLMPTWMRFDPVFIHGMEDVELSLRVQKLGMNIHTYDNIFAFHNEGETISKQSYIAQKSACFGQMYLFPNYVLSVGIFSFLQVLKEGTNKYARFKAIFEAFRMFKNR